MQNILPWHASTWQYLVSRKNIGKLPHAILIKGADGLGKFLFAKNLAALLLCQGSANKTIACGECNSCVLQQAGNHPDLIIVESEDQGKPIKIDQIREVITELNHTAHQGGYKIVIIRSAELLNVAATNALLKTLEEPPVSTIVILISAYPMMLPATIRSRCQTLSIHIPKHFVAKDWLKQQIPDADIDLLLALAKNIPFKALAFAEEDALLKRQEFFQGLYNLQQGKISSLQMVKQCLDMGIDNLLVMLIHIINDLVKIKFATIYNISNQDQVENLTDLTVKVNTDNLFSYLDHLYKLRGYLLNKINLNQQLIMENLIINWQQMLDT